MRLLFVGDVVGRAGRTCLIERLPELRRRLRLDAVVVNAENAAGGFGLTPPIAADLFAAGADALTMGNHTWDQRDLIGHIDQEPRILRPLNMPPGAPGKGSLVLDAGRGRRLLVLQVLGRLFMAQSDDPFRALEAELRRHVMGGGVQAILVDVHAEATSEKQALGHLLDGRVSLVVGTHTHIPTADARILSNGTAYLTDAGMTGVYDSVIGMDKSLSLQRWQSPLPGPRMQPAEGSATLCGVFVETDDRTGLARHVVPVREGGDLAASAP